MIQPVPYCLLYGALLNLLFASPGCSTQAPIGEDSCLGESTVCRADIPVRTFFLPILGGVRSGERSMLTADPFFIDEAEPPLAPHRIAAGADGSIWRASVQKEEVVVQRISAQGDLLEAERLSTPWRESPFLDVTPPPLTPPELQLSADASGRAMIWLSWIADLELSSGDEIILFDRSLSIPARRFERQPLLAVEHIGGVARVDAEHVVVRGASGGTDGLPEHTGFLEKLDAHGARIWRQTQLRDTAGLAFFGPRPPALTPLPTGEVLTQSTVPYGNGTSYEASGSAAGFVVLDENGNFSDAGRLMAPVFRFNYGFLALPDGRLVVAGPATGEGSDGSFYGDLNVARFSRVSETYESFRIVRENYSSLPASALAVDANDDVLVATWWETRDVRLSAGDQGASQAAEQHYLLCRLSRESKRNDCFEVPYRVESMVTVGPSQVVVPSPTGLDRFVLPEP